MKAEYPRSDLERTRWILEHRAGRNRVRPDRPYAYLRESELTASGEVAEVATVFLTNRECPWKCVMCDLWRNTTEHPVGLGEIPAQIRFALNHLPSARILKLYNSGSFFDAGAIPRADWPSIAELCRPFDQVVVECHPRLVGPKVLEFAALLDRPLEVALGLETVHPAALAGLNKRITSHDFERAAAYLKKHGFGLRTFLLVHPPFVAIPEQAAWLKKSIAFASDCGSDVLSLIPLRSGNGGIEELIRQDLAREPTLDEIECAHEESLARGAGRVFCDTWDLQRFSSCPQCFIARQKRVHRMNLTQRIEPRIACTCCENH